jgi:hypothetical protein
MKGGLQMRNTMNFAGLAGIVLMLCSGLTYAQQISTGKYTGSRLGERKPVGVTLEIKSAENGKLSGTLTTYGRGCAGAIEIEGTYEGGKIQLQTPPGRGTAKDCEEIKLELVADGNNLKGRMMGERDIWRDVQLSK